MLITSSANDRVKGALALRSRRQRSAQGLILVEGATEIRRALGAGITPQTLFNPAGFEADLGAVVSASGGEVLEVAGAAADRLAVRGNETPVLVAVRPTANIDDVDPVPPAALVLVIESMEKPGNVGAMFRTADGAGVDAVIVADPNTDVFSPNVIRASIGAVFAVPVAVTDSATAIGWLVSQGVTIVATSPEADTLWSEPDLTGSVACVIGAEHTGLSEQWLAAADESVSIPMLGVGDSLNASTSAAILLYEVRRQRHGSATSPND